MKSTVQKVIRYKLQNFARRVTAFGETVVGNASQKASIRTHQLDLAKKMSPWASPKIRFSRP
ncbi:hypothetical protein PsorP6_005570 [Peronosclerospora sorghi]|uniref:Uncharacterized protein n=1 Tax=Peronosclerospora sorghi TaxID=230839 RepID=A0ACC0W4W1_9STRA|nr:hypothetical protein PsorP6_005570 [Peronosclerospora sorghi]